MLSPDTIGRRRSEKLSLVTCAYPLGAMLCALCVLFGSTDNVGFLLLAMASFVLVGAAATRQVSILIDKATTDELTHVLNRREFDLLFGEVLSSRHEGEPAYALLIVDVDRLKEINDDDGHLGGDEAIRLVGESLKRAVRVDDLVGRWGGDEFVIAASNTRPFEALWLAERVRKTLRQLSRGTHLSRQPTVSIGIATAGVAARRAHGREALFEAADRALYNCKRQGRDRTCLVNAEPGEATTPPISLQAAQLRPVLVRSPVAKGAQG